jgi:hypothetical protein
MAERIYRNQFGTTTFIGDDQELLDHGWEPADTWRVFFWGDAVSDPMPDEASCIKWIEDNYPASVEQALNFDGYAILKTHNVG